MARRKQQVDISETILRPTPRLERWRRIERYVSAYRELRAAVGANSSELATLDADLKDLRALVRDAGTYPPDTPEPEPEEPRHGWSLVPPGSEAFIDAFFESVLLGDEQ